MQLLVNSAQLMWKLADAGEAAKGTLKMKTVFQFLVLANAASPMQVIILELSSRGP